MLAITSVSPTLCVVPGYVRRVEMWLVNALLIYVGENDESGDLTLEG